MVKKILFINLGNFGSTGGIIRDICQYLPKDKFICYRVFPENPLNKSIEEGDIVFENYNEYRVARKLSFLSGYNGCFAICPTLRLIHRIKKFDPDIVHLHNLHNSYINLYLLFRYLRREKKKVIWTFHDCWPFTGQCPHFQYKRCEKWRTGCFDCPSYKEYPEARIDKTDIMWRKKRKWFSGISNMTIITPSQWLADLVKESFMKDYSVKVINNGIDCSVFKPLRGDIRKRYGVSEKKYLVLGITMDWGKSKGLDIVLALDNELNHEKYQIVLIGTTDEIDNKLSSSIISIHRTHNQKELAELYSSADVFINPTREDTYPTVNMEALACGTPVITFDTGGCREQYDSTCGVCVAVDDYVQFKNAIIDVCENHSIVETDCIRYSNRFEKSKMLEAYLNLYED